MSSIRRAFYFASAERYIVILINFAMLPIIARLMGPSEFGISVLGMAALALAEAARDFGGAAYIVQERQLTPERVRTAFTFTLAWTLLLTTILILSAGPLSRFYGVPGLKTYLEVIALSYLIGPFVAPIFALMQRDMAFDKIAMVTIITTLVNASSTIYFASDGYGPMSFALANLISANCGMLLGFYFRPEFSVFRISFVDWRTLFNFGRYQTSAYILSALWDYLPYLIMGRALDTAAIGNYQRAMTVCSLPRRAILGGIAYIALPAFAANLRDGGDFKQNYLRAVSLVTGVHWPSLALTSLLAYPLIVILLGSKWLDVVPLVSIISAALMFNFSVNLTLPSLVAVGGVRQLFLLQIIVVPVSAAVIAFASPYGITAIAWSMFLIVPFEALVSVYFIRQFAPFAWSDLFAALCPSAIVTLSSLAGPLATLASHGWDPHLPLSGTVIAILLGGIGWLAGIWLTNHPLLAELLRVRRIVRNWWQRRGKALAAN